MAKSMFGETEYLLRKTVKGKEEVKKESGATPNPKLGTQELSGDATLLDFIVRSELNARTIPGLRSRNNPIIPPTSKDAVIELIVSFTGKSGIAKLRAILADFQASFCHRLYFPILQNLIGLDLSGEGDISSIESLQRFISLFYDYKNKLKEPVHPRIKILASRPKIHNITKITQIKTGERDGKHLYDGSIMNVSFTNPDGVEETEMVIIAGLCQQVNEEDAKLQYSFVEKYLQNDLSNYNIARFNVFIERPAETYSVLGTGPSSLYVADIFSKKTTLSLSEYVILNMRAESGIYNVNLNVGTITTNPDPDTTVSIHKEYAEYAKTLMRLPGLHDLSSMIGDSSSDQRATIKEMLKGLENILDNDNNIVEELQDSLEKHIQDKYNAYSSASLSQLFDVKGIPVVIDNMRLTFDPNGTLDVIANISLRLFHYKPFVDEFEIDEDLFKRYRDTIFLSNWIMRTTDPTTTERLMKFLSTVVEGKTINRSDPNVLYNYILDTNTLEFSYKKVPKGLSDIGGAATTVSDLEQQGPNTPKLEVTKDLLDEFITVKLPILNEQTSITELSISKSFSLAKIPVLGSRFPTYQYMGAGDTYLRLSFNTVDNTIVSELYNMQSHILNTYKQIDPLLADQVITVKNDIINLFDIEGVVPINIEIRNMPDTNSRYVTMEFVASDTKKDERIALYQDSGKSLSGLEEVLERTAKEFGNRSVDTQDWGVLSAIGYATKSAYRAISNYVKDLSTTSQEMRDRVNVTQRTTATDVTSLTFLEPLLDWLLPILLSYIGDATPKKTLLQSPQTAMFYTTACQGIFSKTQYRNGFIEILRRIDRESANDPKTLFLHFSASKIATWIKSIINQGVGTNNEKAFAKALISFAEYLVLFPDAKTNMPEYTWFQQDGTEITIPAVKLPDSYNPTEHIVRPNTVDVYPDLSLPTYIDTYSNAPYKNINEVISNIWSSDILDIIFKKGSKPFIHRIDTDVLHITTSEYSRYPQLPIIFRGNLKNINNHNIILINNENQIIRSVVVNSIRTYLATESIYNYLVLFLQLSPQQGMKYKDMLLNANDSTSLIDALSSIAEASGLTEPPNTYTNYSKLKKIQASTEREVFKDIEKYLPSYDYYGATPPPLATMESKCKSMYDRVDPGFFIKSADHDTKPKAKILPLVDKEFMRAFIKMVDEGTLPKSITYLTNTWQSLQNKGMSRKDIIEQANSALNIEHTRALDGKEREIYENKVPVPQDVAKGLRLETGNDPLYRHMTTIELPDNDRYGSYDYQGKARALFQYNDMVNHMSAYKRNMIRAYPTAMLWFVEEDTENMYAFDDMYQYTAITSIETIRHKTIGGKAIVTVSNVTGVLTQDRFTLVNNSVIDKLLKDTPSEKTDTTLDQQDILTGEFFQDKIKIMPGTKVIIKMGYGSSEHLLPKVFIGRICGIQGGPELTLDIDGIELELFRPYSGTWGKVSPLWITHDQLVDKTDFSRPIGINPGLLEGDVSIDSAADLWYRALGNKTVTGISGATSKISTSLLSVSLGLRILSLLPAISLSLPISLPLIIGTAIISTGLYLLSAGAERRKTYGVKDTDCTINIYHNERAWAWGFNWIHADFNWTNYGEESFYNLVKLARYHHNLIAGIRYLDEGGTFYMGPSQGHYIFTRSIPYQMLNLYKSDLERNTVASKIMKKYMGYSTITDMANNVIETLFTNIENTDKYVNIYTMIEERINKKLEETKSDFPHIKKCERQDIQNIVMSNFYNNPLHPASDISRSLPLKIKVASSYGENLLDSIFSKNIAVKTNVLDASDPTDTTAKVEVIIRLPSRGYNESILTLLISKDKNNNITYFLRKGNLFPSYITRIIRTWFSKIDMPSFTDNKRMPHTKPFRKYHLIHSDTDIIRNGIYCSTEAMGNTIRIATSETQLAKKYTDLFELCICSSIPPNRRIITPIIDSRFTPGLISTVRSMMGQAGTGQMMWAAMNHLAEAMKPMYRGQLMIIGNPHIEPHDIIYLADMYNNMTGKFEVESVAHSYSKEFGFITVITPHLLTTINDCVDWSRNVIASMAITAVLLAGTALYIGGAAALSAAGGAAIAGAFFLSKASGMGLLPDFTGQGVFSKQLRNPVMFYPLQYKGIPYMAGVDGIEHVGLWDSMQNKWRRSFIGAGRIIDNVGIMGRSLYQENVIAEANDAFKGIR